MPVVLGIVALLVMFSATASAADTIDAVDLSRGVLSQSNCKTAIGCAHETVGLTKGSFTSSMTAPNLAQHILTLALRGQVRATGKGRGPHAFELDYDLVNPSGQANTMICASAIDAGTPVRRCAGGLKRSGRLSLPLSSNHADAVFLHFAAMPLSTGSSFAVSNVRLVRTTGKSGRHVHGGRVAVDLASGRLRQPSCQVPVGCAHPSVTLAADVFASVISGGQPAPPSDNPNAPPPKAPGRLSLEIPVRDLGKGPRRLEFDYAIDGQNGRPPGRIRVWLLAGEHIVETLVDKAGTGRGAVAVPPGSPAVDQVTIAFEPAPGGAGRIEVSGVSYGRGHPDSAPLPEESVTCEICEPPASRLDPCGEFLVTFYVEAADDREGRGIRCVSPDLKSWYGEGWWNDPDWGRYRHLGYVTERSPLGLPSGGVAIDFGDRRAVEMGGAERLVEYGVSGVQTISLEWLSLSSVRVFMPGGSWNEIWTLVPKGELLPHLYGSVGWDGGCGSNGLIAWQEDGDAGFHNAQVRCAIPADFDLRFDPTHAALPLAWYGVGYLEPRSFGRVDADALARPHLGWKTVPAAAPSPVTFYSAADRCVLEHESGCHAYDDIQINVLAEGAPGWEEWGARGPGLNVFGPASWQTFNDDPSVVFGLRWERGAGLPPETALPPPTPVCVDCP